MTRGGMFLSKIARSPSVASSATWCVAPIPCRKISRSSGHPSLVASISGSERKKRRCTQADIRGSRRETRCRSSFQVSQPEPSSEGETAPRRTRYRRSRLSRSYRVRHPMPCLVNALPRRYWPANLACEIPQVEAALLVERCRQKREKVLDPVGEKECSFRPCLT